MEHFRRFGEAIGLSSAAAAAIMLIAGSALAGGYDTGERDWDFLFQQDKVAAEIGVRYVDPQRTLKNVTNTALPGSTASVRESAAFFIPRASVAVRLGDPFRCMGSYRQPFAGYADYGSTWAGAGAAITQDFTSNDYGLTCSGALPVGKGDVQVLAGVSYDSIAYKLTQAGAFGTMTTDVSDDGLGWRTGVAYEIPAYALRASLIYNAAVDYHMHGTFSIPGLPATPIFGSITMPQSVELKAQSGVAPGWLAFGAVKWTNWSVDQNMPLCPVGTPSCTIATSISGLTLEWRDTWTVTAGVVRAFSDKFALSPSFTWDQGASQGFTSQTDTWTAGLTAVITPNKNTRISVGGTAGILTGGSLSTAVLPGGIPNPLGYTASFGDDLVWSLSGSAKINF